MQVVLYSIVRLQGDNKLLRWRCQTHMIEFLNKIFERPYWLILLIVGILLILGIKIIYNNIHSQLRLVWKSYHTPSPNPGAFNDIICLSFSPDGRLLVSSALDGTTKIWDAEKGIILKTIQTYASSLAFSPDGKILALSSGGKIKLYQTNDWQLMKVLQAKNIESNSPIAFSPTGKLIAASGGRWKEIQPNKWVITDGGARIWDISTGNLLDILHPEKMVDVVTFSPINHILAIAARDVNNNASIHIWNIEDWREITDLAVASGYALNDLAFDPNGLYLASGGDDGFIRIWRTDNWTLTITLRDRPHVQTVTFSPDGKLLASKSRGALTLWQVERWNRVARWRLKYKWWLAEISPSKIVTFSPNGKYLAVGDEFGTIYVFEIKR